MGYTMASGNRPERHDLERKCKVKWNLGFPNGSVEKVMYYTERGVYRV